MRHAELRVVSGKQAGSTIPLPEGKFLIGREEDCHLRPNSDLVSRHHCVFTVDEFAVRVRDLGSTNGTLVNGERIRGGVMLSQGDVVSIGKIEFEIQIRDPAQDTDSHMAFGGDTQMSKPAQTPAPEISDLDTSASSETIELPATAGNPSTQTVQFPPGGDTQFMNPMGVPGQPALGYPQMAYPQMMAPYGYPQYPGMYPQQMGYPMPGMYPQQPMPQQYPAAPAPAPEAPPAGSQSSGELPVRLPNPEDTGVKAPPAPPAGGGGPKTAAAKSKEEAPAKAADIIQQYKNRRPTTG